MRDTTDDRWLRNSSVGVSRQPSSSNSRSGIAVNGQVPQPAGGPEYAAFLQEWYSYEEFVHNCRPADPVAEDVASEQVYEEMLQAYAEEVERRFADLQARANALLGACGVEVADEEEDGAD